MSRRRSPNAAKEETTDSFALLTEPVEVPLDALDVGAALAAARLKDHAELISIELPIGPYHDNQCRPGHVDLRLSASQARALQRLRNGLNAHYGEGWVRRKDYSYADVLRWLLDQLPDGEA